MFGNANIPDLLRFRLYVRVCAFNEVWLEYVGWLVDVGWKNYAILYGGNIYI